MNKILLTIISLIASTSFVSAAESFTTAASNINSILTSLYTGMITLVFLTFAWGIVQFLFQEGEEREKGKSTMLWSIIAIVLLFSIGGIVSLFQGTAGISNTKNNTFSKPGLGDGDQNKEIKK